MRHRVRSRVRSGVVVVALGALLGGCGLTVAQRKAVDQFSNATAALGAVASVEIVQMRDNVIKMNVARLTVAGKEPSLPDHTNLDVQFKPENVAQVVKATSALQAYGSTLSALVDDRQGTELNSAADSFVASVRGFPGIKSAASEEQLDAIGTAVRSVGGLLVEYKKKKAVRTIVVGAKNAVDLLCDQLIAEFGPEATRLGAEFLKVTEDLRTSAGSVFLESKRTEERARTLEAFALASVARTRREFMFGKIRDAAGKMKVANNALVKAMEKGAISFKDIEDFSRQTQTLVEAARLFIK